MGFLERFFGIEERGADYIPTPADVFGIGLDQVGTRTTAGIHVNDETILGISAAWRCINILMDVIGTQDCGNFVLKDGVFQPAPIQPQFMRFEQGPYTKSQTIAVGVGSICTAGNAYYAIHRSSDFMVQWLEPLDAEKMEVFRVGAEKRFKVNGQERMENGAPITELDILHIPGVLMAGSLEGLSPSRVLKETIGLTAAATDYGAGFFGNSGIPGAIVEVEGDMSPTGKRALKREWNDMHSGRGNSKQLGILTNGAKFNALSIPPNEAQFLQTRSFQVPEIARIYGVPPSLLAHVEGPEMGKSVEDKAHQFNQYTLTGWFARFSEAFTKLAHSEGGNPNAEIRFNTEKLEQGNFSNFVDNYTKLVKDGIITINEFREKLGRPPVDWGNEPISVQVQDDVNETPEEPEENDD